MPLTSRWLNFADSELIAQTRWQCYGHSGKDLVRMRDYTLMDRRAQDGDFLIVEENGRPVATSTSLSMRLWARSAAFDCQGVAWVGAIKSARRRGTAREAMNQTLRKAREREQVISALMPFRVSYYENFGYGIVERRAEWCIPLELLPQQNPTGDWHIFSPSDQPNLSALRKRCVETGQCNIERTPAGWTVCRAADEHGLTFCSAAGCWVTFIHQAADGKDVLKVSDWGAATLADLLDLFHFLGTLRDQYFSLVIPLPADWQINRLLKESQLPHRPVNHLTADVSTMTRMQVRILDHAKFLSGLNIPAWAKGRVEIEIPEPEGNKSRFAMELDAGRITIKPASGSAGFICPANHWASIATGDLPATQAARMGLATEETPGAAAILDALSVGPLPFCQEYF